MAYVPSCDVLFQTELPKTGCGERAVDRYFEEQNAFSFLTESKTIECLKRGPSTKTRRKKSTGKGVVFSKRKRRLRLGSNSRRNTDGQSPYFLSIEPESRLYFGTEGVYISDGKS